MQQIVYFNLKPQGNAEEFVVFVKETVVPIAKQAGAQQVSLYETKSDALSRYKLQADFENEEAANTARLSEEVKAVDEMFLEFVQDVALIPYHRIC